MKSPIPDSDRIPLLEKVAFGIGNNADAIAISMMISTLWMPFFNIGMGMSPVVLGFVLMGLRAWDAISDPLVGHFTDNARTRWGRRKPFMFVGILAAACIYPLFWFMPRELSDMMKVVYLSGVGVLFFTATTCWGMAYYAMMMEMTPNYDERTRIAFWMSVFGKINTLAGGWIMALVTSSFFADPATGQADIVNGMRHVGWGIAVVFVICGLLPVFFVRERFANSDLVKNRKKEPFWQSIRESVKCRPIWLLIGVSFFLMLGNSSISTLWQYTNIYYVFGGDIASASVLAGWRGTVLVVTSLLAAPFWVWLSERFDKMMVLISMMGVMIVAHFFNILLMRPDMPYLQLVSGAAESIGLSGFFLLLPSMRADVADYDEVNTGRRREGSINAFFSWFLKLGATSALGLSGVVLHITGFNVKAPEQPAEVLRNMHLSYVFLPLAFWGVSIVIALFYKLSRSRMREIRTQLEERRGVV